MFDKITSADLAGKGVIGLPDTPELSAAEMQQKFEETAREVIVPKFNALIDALGQADAAGQIGAQTIDGLDGTTVQMLLQALKEKIDDINLDIVEQKVPDGSITTPKFAANAKAPFAGQSDSSVYARNGIQPLSYTKSGTVHQLTGLAGITGAASCIFMAAAAFNAGDTFTVDGTAYTVQLSNGEEAEDNLFVSGAAVPVIVDTGAKKVNFKAAGSSVKLPAGTTIIWKIFTPETYDASVSDTFVPPVSGKYRVTVIAKGGNGGRSDPQDGAGGGGSGGWASSLLDLTTEDSVLVTVNPSISSFGSYMSATCGSNGSLSSNGTGGTASGGNLFTYNGINAYGSLSSSAGVNGAPVSHPEDSIFLTDVYGLAGFGYYGYTDAGFAPYSKNGYAPFGAGGGGGKGNVNIENNSLREGGYGGKGAVIVEIAIEGVNL